VFTASGDYLGRADIGVSVGGGTPGVAAVVNVVDPQATVGQGTTRELVPRTICLPVGAQVTVDPPAAGTLSIGPGRCGVRFIASNSYLGQFLFAIGGIPGGGGSQVTLYVVPRPAGFTQPSGSASGSFTPVVPPPPPGPCILVTSNPVVTFGDVTVGGPFENGDVTPTVAGCADSSIDQQVLVQTSNATNGSATLTPGCAGVKPTACTPTAGSYAVALVNSAFVDDFVLRSAPTTWMASNRGAFPPTAASFAVKLPTSIDAPAVGTSFTFDITFTATTI
jgi:hypothetical protein